MNVLEGMAEAVSTLSDGLFCEFLRKCYAGWQKNFKNAIMVEIDKMAAQIKIDIFLPCIKKSALDTTLE